jgi:hypothetical protein
LYKPLPATYNNTRFFLGVLRVGRGPAAVPQFRSLTALALSKRSASPT